MTADMGQIGSLFERLRQDPSSLPAFEDYARAVEAAARDKDRDTSRRLAVTLAEHLEKLPALAESRLQDSLDQVARELLGSLDFQELKPGRDLEAALESARSKLASRFPRAQGMTPEEFVALHRSDPERILDFLESCGEDWTRPRLVRCRALLRNAGDLPGDASLASTVAGALADLGNALLDGAPPVYAEVAYRAALHYDPGQPQARAGLGRLARRFGRPSEAELELRAALDREPRLLEALAGIGDLCIQQDRLSEAGAIIDRLLTAHPEQPEGHLLAGRLTLAQGEAEAALPALLEALELDPDRPETFLLLSRAYADLGWEELSREYHEGLQLRRGRDAEVPPLPPVAEAQVDLDPSLVRPAPPPPHLGDRDPDPTPEEALGPLTRREAFRRLLRRCLAASPDGKPDMGPALKARVALRISRDVFDELYDQTLSEVSTPGSPTADFDPVEYFEELRGAAWRDGYLSPAERHILEDVLACLDIDRRRGRRRPD